MELQLVNAGPYEAAQGQDFPLHSHTEWEIVCYRSGTIQVVLGPDNYDVVPGMLVLTPPGIAHAEYAHTAYSNYYLGINAPTNQPWPRVCMDDAEQTLTHLCRWLVREWHSHHADRSDLLSLLLQQLDLLLQRTASAPPLSISEKLAAEAERYMQERYHHPLTIGEIASALGISSATLRKHVVQARGCAPIVFLQRLRARHACELLQTSDLTLETIARLCGYDSASHLSRHLKKITGKTPGAWRTH
ncbi:helix-turn-helix domain-containing protein [Tengunoibacter tsumagoiensis]|uniref:HTH araC/xylS-type domain-containing protein n=1 Tax=Tengunoibacter tsumagoiensis TaxID=2014871 RepID=A0A402A1L6_9CHLR|nr:helix-turn-helix domain-containing protein [Tengunoibacter tsumagoiensis]GCE13037.1 hypothetical protein KTT_28960 [Tengunoibacter tsumagoiensis]